MLGVAGVTAIDTNVAEVTVSKVLPAMPALRAAIVVLPTAAPLASPCEPLALLTLATLGSLEDQVTCVVRSCVELSEKVPVAVNGRLTPFGMLGVAGVTAIDTKRAEVTVSK